MIVTKFKFKGVIFLQQIIQPEKHSNKENPINKNLHYVKYTHYLLVVKQMPIYSLKCYSNYKTQNNYCKNYNKEML